MKRLSTILATAICLAPVMTAQAQAPSSRKIPFNNVATTITCAPDPSPCQRSVKLQLFDAATGQGTVGAAETQTVSVDDSAGDAISFVLGSTRPTGVDPNDFQAGSSRFLDVLDAATSNSVLPARIELTAVAFAVNPGPQGPAGPQGPQGNPGPQGPPGVVQSVSAGDASISTGGSPAAPTVSVATNGITNDKVANGALSPAKIAGNAATLGSNNNFAGNGSFAAGLAVGNVAGFNIAAAPAGATESGTLVTITTTAPHSFNPGDLVTISGVAETGYNGTFYLALPGSATTFTYVAPTAGLAASGGGTAVSGALLSVTKANSSPTLALATPLLSITNIFDAEASISFDGASGNPSTAWRIGVNRPPDNPSFFNGLFFFKYPVTRMAITPGGRVGIGTTIPSKLLDVAGDGNFNGSLSAGSGTFTGGVTANSFTGSGAGLTNLPAANLTGAVPSAAVSGTYASALAFTNAANAFTGNGAGLVNLDATHLTNGIRVQQNTTSPNIINGFSGNSVAGGVYAATIAGGGSNGFTNAVNGNGGTVAGGFSNTVSADYATVGGGWNNTASGISATVAGGQFNTASGTYATVSGGYNNVASGNSATVAGGLGNSASGYASFAAGTYANANHDGCFVWGDSSPVIPATPCPAPNQFVARASGGVIFYTTFNGSTGVQLAAGGGSWSSLSDRNVKEHFAAIDPHELLARVTQLPIQSWNYKSQNPAIRHIGPMAQDFYAAFHVGEDDRHITDIDEAGVALAAIQGLNQKLEEAREQIKEQADQIRELREAIRQLSERASSAD